MLRTWCLLCDKLDECGLLIGDKDDCINNAEDSAQDEIDNCDDYRGGLAYKCLQDVKKGACDDPGTSPNCDEFNDKCGYTEETAVEYEGGMTVVGLGDVRFDAAASAP